MPVHAIDPSALCIAAMMAFGVPLPAQGLASPGPVARPDSAPTPSQEKSFSRLSDEANEAATAGQWDTALEAAHKGLDILPEHESSHDKRAELMELVGNHQVERRSRPQIEASVAILRGYLEDLDNAYLPDDVSKMRAWNDAHSYLADLERRLPPPPPAPAVELLDPEQPSKATEAAKNEDEGPRPGTGMQVVGAIATAVGGVFVIAGIAFVGVWSRNANECSRLRGEALEVDPCARGTVPDRAWRGARGTALGLGIPGLALLGTGIALLVVGTRRAKENERLALTPSGIGVRF